MDGMCVKMKYAIIMVEGIHDLMVVYRMLRLKKFVNIKKIADIPIELRKCIPNKFPFNDDNIEQRIAPCPTFMKNDNITVLINQSGGQTKMLKDLNTILKTSIKAEDLANLKTIGLIFDADNLNSDEKMQTIVDEFDSLASKMELVYSIKDIKSGSGSVYGFNVRYTCFILPDNENNGFLEDMLIDSAKQEYDDLLTLAEEYVEKVPQEYKRKWKPADKKKAVIGCMSNILKPGRANQVSIHDDKWINHLSVKDINSHKRLFDFISEIVE